MDQALFDQLNIVPPNGGHLYFFLSIEKAGYQIPSDTAKMFDLREITKEANFYNKRTG